MVYLSDLPEDGGGETFFPAVDAPADDTVRSTLTDLYKEDCFIVQVNASSYR
jgi:hypothetical protein